MSPHETDARLEQMLEACFDSLQRGEEPNLDEVCPDAQLRSRLERLLQRERLAIDAVRAGRAEAPHTGTRIGDYEIIRPLARGGMGVVYLARHGSLPRQVALKVLTAGPAADPVRRLRFRREAEITAALDHPNIVPVFETGAIEGSTFIAMKLVGGASLDRIALPLEPERVASIGVQIASALHAAHEVGVFHRDVKPGNVMLDAETAFVLDFGLARSVTDATLTGEGHAPGTLAYMSPEQLTAATGGLDARLDVYGVGATMYHLLAGRPPFDEPNYQALVRRVLFYEPARLGLRGHHRDLEVIVRRAMEKQPQRRFATAAELADDLTRYIEHRPIRSRPPHLGRRLALLARRNRVATIVFVAALITSVLLLAVVADRTATVRAQQEARREGIRTALSERRYADAWRRVQETVRGDPEDEALRARVRSWLDLDALLSRLVSDGYVQGVEHLAGLLARVESGVDEVRQAPAARLAACVFAYYQQQADDLRRGLAHQGLERFPETRTALQVAIGDLGPAAKRPPADRGGDPLLGADDLVFAAVVARGEDRPPEVLRDYLDRALALKRVHPRALHLRAVLALIRGDLDGAETIALGALGAGNPRPETHELLARIAVRRGNRSQTELHLRDAAAIVRRDGLPASLSEAVIRAEALFEWAEPAELFAALDELQSRWGPRARWDLLRGHAHHRSGDSSAARAAFEAAVAAAKHPWTRRQADLALLQQHLLERRSAAGQPRGDPPTDATLLERATSIARAAQASLDFRVESDAWFAAFQVAGELEHLRSALSAEDGHTLANYKFVQYVYLEVRGALSNPSAGNAMLDIGQRVGEARRRVRALATRVQASPAHLATKQLEEVWLYDAFLAMAVRDGDGALHACDEAAKLQLRRGATEDDRNVRARERIRRRAGVDR